MFLSLKSLRNKGRLVCSWGKDMQPDLPLVSVSPKGIMSASLRTLLFTLIAVFYCVSGAVCQIDPPNPVTPSNNTGVQPYSTYDGVRENIALSNGNLSLSIPLLTLPQRTGPFELGIEYDSKIKFHIGETVTTPPKSIAVVAWYPDDVVFPVIAPNLRLSVPTLVALN